MTEQERNDMILEARAFYLSAPLVMPILAKRRDNVIAKLRLAHQKGDTNHTALVAELSVLSDIEQEIKQKDQIYRTLEAQNGN